MKLVVDMNLGPEWLPVLRCPGWEVEHWEVIGVENAEDEEIFGWAEANHTAVFTQDLDFIQLLHVSGARGPSVILLRIADELDERLRHRVARLIHQAEKELLRGVILTITEKGARVRDLPLPSARRRKRSP